MGKWNSNIIFELLSSKKVFSILSSILVILGIILAIVVMVLDKENQFSFDVLKFLVVSVAYFCFSLLFLRFLK